MKVWSNITSGKYSISRILQILWSERAGVDSSNVFADWKVDDVKIGEEGAHELNIMLYTIYVVDKKKCQSRCVTHFKNNKKALVT